MRFQFNKGRRLIFMGMLLSAPGALLRGHSGWHPSLACPPRLKVNLSSAALLLVADQSDYF